MALTLPRLCSARAKQESFILLITRVFSILWNFLSKIAIVQRIVEVLLMVAKDKIKLVSNIIKTLKDIFARGNKVLLCALYKGAGDGRNKLFTLILGNRSRHLYWICLEKKSQMSSVLVNPCKPLPCFISCLPFRSVFFILCPTRMRLSGGLRESTSSFSGYIYCSCSSLGVPSLGSSLGTVLWPKGNIVVLL